MKLSIKHITFCLAIALGSSTTASAQWLRVWQNGESTRYAQSEASTIPYATAGQTLTIGSDNYSTAEIDSITIVQPVTITWNGNSVNINIPDNVEGVTANVSGGNVIINNTNTWSEQEFVLAGTSTAGSLIYNGEYKAKFHLNGVNLTSTIGSAIDIQCGKRIDVIVEDGTTNTLADLAAGDQKAAFNCQGHVEMSGTGSLTITGKSKHALRTKEYLFIKKSFGTLTIASAASDGIHCGEWYQQNGGTVSIGNTSGDGLQVETADASDEELNGTLIVNGGKLTVNVVTEDTKGIRCDAAATNTAIVPELNILAGSVTVNVTSTASGAKGIASDGTLTIGSTSTSPTVNVTVAAGTYTDPSTEEENRATGIKAETTLTIAGGATTVSATGNKARGVRAATLTATGGSLTVTNTGTKSQGIKLDNAFVSGQGGTVTGTIK